MILTYLTGGVVLIVSSLILYVMVHIQEEQRQKKGLPLIWEKGGLYEKYFGRDVNKGVDKNE
jgi:hypothetical protein